MDDCYNFQIRSLGGPVRSTKAPWEIGEDIAGASAGKSPIGLDKWRSKHWPIEKREQEAKIG